MGRRADIVVVVRVHFGSDRRIHVGRGSDASGAAQQQQRTQQRVVTGVNLEAVLREVLDIGTAVFEIAAAVLHALQRTRKCLQQSSDQINAERYRGLLREIVQIVLDAR